MASKYRISMVKADGTAIRLYPGSHGERDFVQAIIASVKYSVPTITAKVVSNAAQRGIGLFKTTEHVSTDLTAALQEILLGAIEAAVEDGVERAILSVKQETFPI